MSDNTNTHEPAIDAGDVPCQHPTLRLYAWWARDDTVIGGQVLCVGCRACGAILQGGATLETEP